MTAGQLAKECAQNTKIQLNKSALLIYTHSHTHSHARTHTHTHILSYRHSRTHTHTHEKKENVCVRASNAARVSSSAEMRVWECSKSHYSTAPQRSPFWLSGCEQTNKRSETTEVNNDIECAKDIVCNEAENVRCSVAYILPFSDFI